MARPWRFDESLSLGSFADDHQGIGRMTGAEKRAFVLQEARTIGLAIGTALLNLVIETAVNRLRK